MLIKSSQLRQSNLDLKERERSQVHENRGACDKLLQHQNEGTRADFVCLSKNRNLQENRMNQGIFILTQSFGLNKEKENINGNYQI